jgi:hypothetical protein
MAGTTTLLPGRGWIANALACALILVLAPPILLSVVLVVLALTPALAFLFVLLLAFALPLFLIVAAVRFVGAAVSLPVTLPTSGGKLVSGLTSAPSLSTDGNLSDLLADLEDSTDEIAGSSDSSDDSSSILEVDVDKMKREWREKVSGWLTYESMMETVFAEQA